MNAEKREEDPGSRGRRRIIRCKKAFLFTLGLLFVALAILAFSKFVFEESEDEEILFQTIAAANRLDDIDSSLQRSIADAFISYSGIKASLDNSTLTIEEPFPNGMGALELSLLKLKALAEADETGNETGILLSFDESSSSMPINVLPMNLTYAHNFSSGEILLLFDNSSSSMLKYRTTIRVEENMTCDWSFMPGNFSYELEVISPDDSGCDHDRLLDLSENATITMTSDSSDSSVTISLGSRSIKITADNSSAFASTVTSDIYFLDKPEEVWLSSPMININFTMLGLTMTGGVRII